jgi:hypothetical protein
MRLTTGSGKHGVDMQSDTVILIKALFSCLNLTRLKSGGSEARCCFVKEYTDIEKWCTLSGICSYRNKPRLQNGGSECWSSLRIQTYQNLRMVDLMQAVYFM